MTSVPGNARRWLLVAASGAAGVLTGTGAGYTSSRLRAAGPLLATVRLAGPEERGTNASRRSEYCEVLSGFAAERLRILDAIVQFPQAEHLRSTAGAASPVASAARCSEALVERARLFLEEAHSPTLALADLDAVLRQPSGDPAAEALYLRARARLEAGSLAEALGDARLFLDLFPRSWRAVEAALLACEILESESRLSEAVALAEEALARDPDRADRAMLDPGERGRYPARTERLCLKLGRLYLRAGELASAEAAFDLVASPPVGRDDFGEAWLESPLLAEALVGRAEAVLASRDARELRVREELAAWAARWGEETPHGRRAASLLGKPPGALGRAESGDLRAAARELASSGPRTGATLRELAAIALGRAWFDPAGSLELGTALVEAGATGDAAELAALARSRAFEASGRLAEAVEALRRHGGVRAMLALADLARRKGDGGLVREALGMAAARSALARELLSREGRQPGVPEARPGRPGS